jgi:hypothetical protein
VHDAISHSGELIGAAGAITLSIGSALIVLTHGDVERMMDGSGGR